MTWWRRLALLLPWRRRAAERDMQEELRTIAAMAEPCELGNLAIAAEDARFEWGWTRLEQTGQDVRYALRNLRKRPGFTATAVLSLALGIGANTALFTLINTVTWRLLPVRDPEHLLVLGQQDGASTTGPFTYVQFQSIGRRASALDLAAYSRVTLNVSIDGRMEPTTDGLLVSGTYFPLLGVRPVRGRLLGPDDDRVPLGHAVAVISDGYWRSRFARDPGIVGRQLSLSGVPFTIVGVAPPEFFGVEVGAAPAVFVPVMMQPIVMPVAENWLDRPGLYFPWLGVIGRVKPGATLAQADAQLRPLGHEDGWRPRNKSTGLKEDTAVTFTSAGNGLSDLRRQYSLPLLILMGVVGIVLLIACANTGNLVLARSAARRSEFALRLALGAGRSRLIRQVLIEGLVLAGFAGASGIALAFLATRALVAYASTGQSAIVLDLSADVRVLEFTAAVSTLAGLLFSCVPAIRAARLEATLAGRPDLSTTRHAIAGKSGPRQVLVVLQVALSLVLLVGAAVFLRSLQNLNRRGSGTDRSRVLIVRVEPRGSDQRNIPGTTERLDRIYRTLVERVERIPGVESASLARTSPLSPIGFSASVTLPSGVNASVQTLMIYPRYFTSMGMAMLKGRDFNEGDLRQDAPLVAVVNEAFVRDMLDGREPLGVAHGITMADRTVRPGTPPGSLPLNIVGVVHDSDYPNLREATPPMMYQTFLQTRTGRGQMVLHVKMTKAANEIARRVREEVQAIDRDVPVFQVHTLADEVDAVLVRERLLATLSSFFGAVALVLVSVGLYGLLAFMVSQQTAEIGIRVALGATRTSVRWMIARRTLTLVCVGIAMGAPAAWVLGRVASGYISSLLFQLTPWDPISVATATVVLALVAASAGVLPARRAARIDPIVALRSE